MNALPVCGPVYVARVSRHRWGWAVQLREIATNEPAASIEGRTKPEAMAKAMIIKNQINERARTP